jgi:hypothetical protein
MQLSSAKAGEKRDSDIRRVGLQFAEFRRNSQIEIFDYRHSNRGAGSGLGRAAFKIAEISSDPHSRGSIRIYLSSIFGVAGFPFA